MKPNHIRTLESDQIYTDNREGASDRNWKVREDIPENKEPEKENSEILGILCQNLYLDPIMTGERGRPKAIQPRLKELNKIQLLPTVQEDEA